MVDERAKFGPVPVSEKAQDEAAQKVCNRSIIQFIDLIIFQFIIL